MGECHTQTDREDIIKNDLTFLKRCLALSSQLGKLMQEFDPANQINV